MFSIVLHQPQIPQNTGNLGRLCVNTGSRLVLIRPFAFSLDEKYLRRAGLDYWKHLDLVIHDSWEDFLDATNPDRLLFFSTKAEKCFWDHPYPDDACLVFGSETSGLPESIHEQFGDKFRRIPMDGVNSRSFNLANSVAIALFEGIRRTRVEPA